MLANPVVTRLQPETQYLLFCMKPSFRCLGSSHESSEYLKSWPPQTHMGTQIKRAIRGTGLTSRKIGGYHSDANED